MHRDNRILKMLDKAFLANPSSNEVVAMQLESALTKISIAETTLNDAVAKDEAYLNALLAVGSVPVPTRYRFAALEEACLKQKNILRITLDELRDLYRLSRGEQRKGVVNAITKCLQNLYTAGQVIELADCAICGKRVPPSN